MSANLSVSLISDRPDQSRELADYLAHIFECRVLTLQDGVSPGSAAAAVITDVDLRNAANIARLRPLLRRPRASATPIITLLRENSHLGRVQAAALGASAVFPANASPFEISAGVTAAFGLSTGQPESSPQLPAAQNVAEARFHFGALFRAAARDEVLKFEAVNEAAACVIAAVAEGGIREWLKVVWSYDDATYQHCMLVTGLAGAFAAALRFSERDQKQLVRGALLHDVGKAKIPLGILNKPGVLTDEERTIMRGHAPIGYELLRRQGDYSPELLEVVLHHHELLDGSGYPDGLAGPQINDLVRLVTICDIYAALIEHRPYRQPMPTAEAFKILHDMEGKLEGALVRAFGQVAESAALPVSA
jgi:putative nucleotidyltransferase with HDIG domain